MVATPPPFAPPFGLSVEELVRYHRRATNYARFRIQDAGAREYGEEDQQLIENYDPARCLLEIRQEIADAINYLVGLDLQIGRWQDRIQDVG
jgi:hypothetical protein